MLQKNGFSEVDGAMKKNFVFTNMFFHLLIKDFFLTIRDKGSVCSTFLHLQVQIKP